MNMTERLSPEIERLLRERKIYARELLRMPMTDLRMDMIALGSRRWDILQQSPEAMELFYTVPTERERRKGFTILPRKYKAILYETTDTEEPRHLLVTPKMIQPEGLRDSYPLILFTSDPERPLEQQIGEEAALQALRDGVERGTPVMALGLEEIILDDDPRRETKERLREEPKPDRLYGTPMRQLELSHSMREKVRAEGLEEAQLLLVRLDSEEIGRVARGEASGILVRAGGESEDLLLEPAPGEEGKLLSDRYRAVVLQDETSGEELLARLVTMPLREGSEERSVIVKYEADNAAHPHFADLLTTTDAEYLLSRGFWRSDSFIYLPIQTSLKGRNQRNP